MFKLTVGAAPSTFTDVTEIPLGATDKQQSFETPDFVWRQ